MRGLLWTAKAQERVASVFEREGEIDYAERARRRADTARRRAAEARRRLGGSQVSTFQKR